MEIKGNMKQAITRYIEGALNNKSHNFGYDRLNDYFCKFNMTNDIKANGIPVGIEVHSYLSGADFEGNKTSQIKVYIVVNNKAWAKAVFNPEDIEGMTEKLEQKRLREIEHFEREIEAVLTREIDSKNRYYGY